MAAEKVKERPRKAARALDAAGAPYAVVGGNAVAEWVARVDEAAVRNTRDVDLLVRRADFPATRACLESVGFTYYLRLDLDTLIGGPQGKPSGGIRLLYSGAKVRTDDDKPSHFVEPFKDLMAEHRRCRMPMIQLNPLPAISP